MLKCLGFDLRRVPSPVPGRSTIVYSHRILDHQFSTMTTKHGQGGDSGWDQGCLAPFFE